MSKSSKLLFTILFSIIFYDCASFKFSEHPPKAMATYKNKKASIYKIKIFDDRPANDTINPLGLDGIDDTLFRRPYLMNDLEYIKLGLKKDLYERGLNVEFVNKGEYSSELHLKEFRIVAGYNDMYVVSKVNIYHYFSADLITKGDTNRIISFFGCDKTPSRLMASQKRLCIDIPQQLQIKDISGKLNKNLFKLKSESYDTKNIINSLKKYDEKISSELVYNVYELALTNDTAVFDVLRAILKNKNKLIKNTAAAALGLIQSEKVYNFLIEYYKKICKEDTTGFKYQVHKSSILKSIGDYASQESNSFLNEIRNSKEYKKSRLVRNTVDLYLSSSKFNFKKEKVLWSDEDILVSIEKLTFPGAFALTEIDLSASHILPLFININCKEKENTCMDSSINAYLIHENDSKISLLGPDLFYENKEVRKANKAFRKEFVAGFLTGFSGVIRLYKAEQQRNRYLSLSMFPIFTRYEKLRLTVNGLLLFDLKDCLGKDGFELIIEYSLNTKAKKVSIELPNSFIHMKI